MKLPGEPTFWPLRAVFDGSTTGRDPLIYKWIEAWREAVQNLHGSARDVLKAKPARGGRDHDSIQFASATAVSHAAENAR